LEDWEYGYVNVTHAINNGIISLTNKGRMDQVFELMGLDLINGNEDAGLDFDNGRAHFPLTQVHPSSDFWGAGRSSYNWSADSRGGSGSFRADIRVEIK
jgi:hypothetical protein